MSQTSNYYSSSLPNYYKCSELGCTLNRPNDFGVTSQTNDFRINIPNSVTYTQSFNDLNDQNKQFLPSLTPNNRYNPLIHRQRSSSPCCCECHSEVEDVSLCSCGCHSPTLQHSPVFIHHIHHPCCNCIQCSSEDRTRLESTEELSDLIKENEKLKQQLINEQGVNQSKSRIINNLQINLDRCKNENNNLRRSSSMAKPMKRYQEMLNKSFEVLNSVGDLADEPNIKPQGNVEYYFDKAPDYDSLIKSQKEFLEFLKSKNKKNDYTNIDVSNSNFIYDRDQALNPFNNPQKSQTLEKSTSDIYDFNKSNKFNDSKINQADTISQKNYEASKPKNASQSLLASQMKAEKEKERKKNQMNTKIGKSSRPMNASLSSKLAQGQKAPDSNKSSQKSIFGKTNQTNQSPRNTNNFQQTNQMSKQSKFGPQNPQSQVKRTQEVMNKKSQSVEPRIQSAYQQPPNKLINPAYPGNSYYYQNPDFDNKIRPSFQGKVGPVDRTKDMLNFDKTNSSLNNTQDLNKNINDFRQLLNDRNPKNYGYQLGKTNPTDYRDAPFLDGNKKYTYELSGYDYNGNKLPDFNRELTPEYNDSQIPNYNRDYLPQENYNPQENYIPQGYDITKPINQQYDENYPEEQQQYNDINQENLGPSDNVQPMPYFEDREENPIHDGRGGKGKPGNITNYYPEDQNINNPEDEVEEYEQEPNENDDQNAGGNKGIKNIGGNTNQDLDKVNPDEEEGYYDDDIGHMQKPKEDNKPSGMKVPAGNNLLKPTQNDNELKKDIKNQGLTPQPDAQNIKPEDEGEEDPDFYNTGGNKNPKNIGTNEIPDKDNNGEEEQFYDQDGEQKYKPEINEENEELPDPSKERIKVVGLDGKPIYINGKEVEGMEIAPYVGGNKKPLTDEKGNIFFIGPNGEAVSQDKLQPIVTGKGLPLINKDGYPALGIEDIPLFDDEGNPIVGPNVLTDNNNKPIEGVVILAKLGPDGKPIKVKVDDKPGIGQSNKPGMGQSTKPGVKPSTKPGISQGGEPGVSQTNKPGIGQSNKPGTGQTNKPGIGQSNKPGTGQTNKPGIGQSNKPGIGQSNKPGTGQTNKPGTGQTNKPGVGQSTKPGMGQSTKPKTPISSSGKKNPLVISGLPKTDKGLSKIGGSKKGSTLGESNVPKYKPVIDRDGNKLCDSKGEPLKLNELTVKKDPEGNVLTDENGEVLLFSKDNKPVKNTGISVLLENGKPVLNDEAELIFVDEEGEELNPLEDNQDEEEHDVEQQKNKEEDKKEEIAIKVKLFGLKPLVDEEGKVITDKDGYPIIIGSNGKPIKNIGLIPLLDEDGRPKLDEDGEYIFEEEDEEQKPEKKNNYKLLLDANGYPKRDKNGNFIIIGSDGKPVKNIGLVPVLDENGKPVVNDDGDFIFTDEDEFKELDAKPATDSKGKVILDENGNPILIGKDGKQIKNLGLTPKIDSQGRPVVDENGDYVLEDDNNKALMPLDNKSIRGKSRRSSQRTQAEKLEPDDAFDKNGHPIYDKNHNKIKLTDLKPVLKDNGECLKDENGKPLIFGPDGKRIKELGITLYVDLHDKPIKENNKYIFIGPDGMAINLNDLEDEQIEEEYENEEEENPDNNEKPEEEQLIGKNNKPLVDSKGEPITASGIKPLTDSEGKVISDLNNNPVLLDQHNKPIKDSGIIVKVDPITNKPVKDPKTGGFIFQSSTGQEIVQPNPAKPKPKPKPKPSRDNKIRPKTKDDKVKPGKQKDKNKTKTKEQKPGQRQGQKPGQKPGQKQNQKPKQKQGQNQKPKPKKKAHDDDDLDYELKVYKPAVRKEDTLMAKTFSPTSPTIQRMGTINPSYYLGFNNTRPDSKTGKLNLRPCYACNMDLGHSRSGYSPMTFNPFKIGRRERREEVCKCPPDYYQEHTFKDYSKKRAQKLKERVNKSTEHEIKHQKLISERECDPHYYCGDKNKLPGDFNGNCNACKIGVSNSRTGYSPNTFNPFDRKREKRANVADYPPEYFQKQTFTDNSLKRSIEVYNNNERKISERVCGPHYYCGDENKQPGNFSGNCEACKIGVSNSRTGYSLNNYSPFNRKQKRLNVNYSPEYDGQRNYYSSKSDKNNEYDDDNEYLENEQN